MGSGKRLTASLMCALFCTWSGAANTALAADSSEVQAAPAAANGRNRDSAIDLFNKGTDFLQSSKYKEAQEFFNKSIEADTTFPHPYLNRAIIKQETHDLSGALADLNRAIQLMPEFASAWNQRALVKQEMGDYSGSLLDSDKAITLQPLLCQSISHA